MISLTLTIYQDVEIVDVRCGAIECSVSLNASTGWMMFSGFISDPIISQILATPPNPIGNMGIVANEGFLTFKRWFLLTFKRRVANDVS